jgi:hypothetical protein
MGCKNFGLKGTHFWGFLAFVLTSFVKILEVGSPFPLCVSMQTRLYEETVQI